MPLPTTSAWPASKTAVWRATPTSFALFCPCSAQKKDYLTTVEVLANPIEATNQFFAGFKPILKTAGHIEQQEILISRFECRLM
jgi:hypothetical protein